MRKILLIIVLVLVVVTSVQLWLTGDFVSLKTDTGSVQSTGEAQVGGSFSLTDHNGKTVSDKDFHGYVSLVFFGFTSCPDVCPVTLATLTKTMELLGEKANQVIPVFITVDPKNDTSEVMKNYISNFDKRMVGLTGTDEQIKAAQSAYKVYAAQRETHENGHAGHTMDHSSYIYVMGKDGVFLNVFSYDSPPKDIAAMVENYLSK
jgi:cytochrome oxidase Cu insertion factor (SCO1/SenC/PrrC family)